MEPSWGSHRARCCGAGSARSGSAGANAPLARRALSGTRKSEATSWRAAGLIYPGQSAQSPLLEPNPKFPKSPKVSKGRTVLCSHR